MVRNKMTSWTLNVALFTMAAAAAFLPSPGEMKRAFEYTRAQHQIVTEQKVLIPEALVTEQVRSISGVSVASYGISPCLDGSPLVDPDRIAECLPEIADNIRTYDMGASRRIEAGMDVQPNPRVEAMRLAVARVCRSQWSTTQNSDVEFADNGCRDVLQGIAY